MTAPEDQLRQLDARGRRASVDLTGRAAARPMPAFDPESPTIAALPGSRSTTRHRALAAAAVVLVVAAIGGLLIAQRGGDEGNDKAEVISGKPRPFVAGDLPTGFALAGAGEITGDDRASDQGGIMAGGPVTLYGPTADEPRLAITALPAGQRWADDGGTPEVDLGHGRTGYRYDGMGLGKHVWLVFDGDRALMITTPTLDDEQMRKLASEASASTSGQIDLHDFDLPDGWDEIGRYDDSFNLENPLLSTTDPSAVGNYVMYTKGFTGSSSSGTSSGDGSSAAGTEPSVDDISTLMVSSTPGEELQVWAAAAAADASVRTTVRGHDALITTTQVGRNGADGASIRTVAWIERPGELIRVSGTGFSEKDLLATAAGVEPVGAAEWDDLIERSQLGEFDPANTGDPAPVKVGEGRFPDGTRWLLGASASEDPDDPDPTARFSVTVAHPGDSSSNSGIASQEGGVNGHAVLSTEIVESGGGTFAGSLVGPAVTRIELQDRKGDVMAEPEIVEGNGYRGFAAVLTTDALDLVAFAADGTELSRTRLDLDSGSSSGSSGGS